MTKEQLYTAHKELAKRIGKDYLPNVGTGEFWGICLGIFEMFGLNHYDSIILPDTPENYPHLYWSLTYKMIEAGEISIEVANEVFNKNV